MILLDVQKGWKANAFLPPLLKARRMTQQQLADEIGTDRITINGYCTGRRDLGMTNAKKIADALRVTVLDLGAPEGADGEEEGRPIHERLEEVAAQATRDVIELRKDLAQAIRRIRALEKQAGSGDQPATGAR